MAEATASVVLSRMAAAIILKSVLKKGLVEADGMNNLMVAKSDLKSCSVLGEESRPYYSPSRTPNTASDNMLSFCFCRTSIGMTSMHKT